VPAPASLSIAAVVGQVGRVGLPDPVGLAPGLRDVLGGVVDPRRWRGVRRGLVVVLAVAACAAHRIFSPEWTGRQGEPGLSKK
jgi:hypothetical protein